MSPAPLTREQLEDKLAVWQQRLDLLHWDLEFDFDRSVDADDEDDAGTIAVVDAQDRVYDRARIRLARGWEAWPADAWGTLGELTADYCLLHELVHCLLRDCDRAAMHLTADHLHRDSAQLRDTVYHEARERAVDHLARALLNGWGPA
ncbi:MAG: hypothetical protein AABM42_11345 [Actinomycetota bacterium]